MKINVGCCGWAKGKTKYFKNFTTGEIQSTFYRLPKIQTAMRWRKEAPKEFTYCAKAWQAITHSTNSPTWRRSGFERGELERREYGFLRPTEDNFEAWKKTLEICQAIGVQICVIQCPASFKCSEENITNMKKFLSKIERGGVLLAWEPRGNWLNHLDTVKKLCGELDLIHAVDPLRTPPQGFGKKKIAYFRLHGFGKPSMYNYKYTEQDFERLTEILEEIGAKDVFCMFNNIHMFEDAQRFQVILKNKFHRYFHNL